MTGGALRRYEQFHTCRVGNPQTGKAHPQGSELQAPCQLPKPGHLALACGDPGEAYTEDQQGLSAATPQDWGKQILHSWRVHTGFHVHWVPGQSRDSTGIWVRPTCRSLRISWENGATMACCRGRTIEAMVLGIIISENPPEVTILEKSDPTHQGWETSGQTTNTAPPISKQAA